MPQDKVLPDISTELFQDHCPHYKSKFFSKHNCISLYSAHTLLSGESLDRKCKNYKKVPTEHTKGRQADPHLYLATSFVAASSHTTTKYHSGNGSIIVIVATVLLVVVVVMTVLLFLIIRVIALAIIPVRGKVITKRIIDD